MSKEKNRQFNDDKAFLDHLRSTSVVCVNGVLLTQKRKIERIDRETAIEAVFHEYLILIDLTSTIGTNNSILKDWAKYILRCDLAEVSDILKDVFQYCARYENGARTVTYAGFKHLFLQSESTIDMDALLRPLDIVFEEFLEYPNPIDLSTINTFCCFLSRLNLPSLDYTDACVKSYIELEESFDNVVTSQRTIDELNLIIREWMDEFTITELKPQHGPGGVARLGRCSLYDKYKCFRTDQLLDYFLSEFPSWTEGNKPILESHSCNDVLRRVAELRVVPKSMTKNRTICMEDPTLQYFQKAIARDLKRYVSSSHKPAFKRNARRRGIVYEGSVQPYLSIDSLRDHIDFFDQAPNQEWAREGSLNGTSYATVDLSNASDSVRYNLVKSLFRGTKLLRYIVCTRSHSFVLPDGNTLPMRKAYPSGSALCFDIETIVFAAIGELAVRRSRAARTHNEFRVFGDDIVIRPEYLGYLVDLLDELGFQLNASKSFWDGYFRESCGGEYYKGTSITPMRISRKYKTMLREDCPGAIDNRIEYANRCALYQFRRLRRFLIDDLFQQLRKFYPSSDRPLLPVMIDNVNYLYSSEPSNFHLAKTLNSDLQCEDIHHGATCSRDTYVNKAQKPHYERYLEEHRDYYNQVQRLLRQGYFLPNAKDGAPLEQLPMDYEDLRYQLWIDLSSTRIVGNLDFLCPDHSANSIRTTTEYYGRAVYHNS